MQNLFFKSYDALSDVRVHGCKVFLYNSDGTEYPHAVVDKEAANLLVKLYESELFSEGEKTNLCRSLYAKDSFVNYVCKSSAENTRYNKNKGVVNVMTARNYYMAGRKIDAIKEIRSTFVPKLGLKETKELLEYLCE